MYYNMLGQHIVVLSSAQAVADLFEKRSAIYSDRTTTTMIHDLMDLGWVLVLMQYGDRWRRARRMMHQYFYADASCNFQEVQLRDARTLLRHLQVSPEEFLAHIRL